MTLLVFNFINADGCGTNISEFIQFKGDVSDDLYNQIKDAIASYFDDVDDADYDSCIKDVLGSFGFKVGIDWNYADYRQFNI